MDLRKIDVEHSEGNDTKVQELRERSKAEAAKGQLAEALESIREAQSLATDTVQRALCRYQYAETLLATDHASDALPVLIELLEFSRKEDTELKTEQLLNQIGICYKELGDFDNCLLYYRQAYEVFYQQENLKGMAGVLINIGNVYKVYERYDGALEHYNRALELIGEREGFEEHRALMYSSVGGIHRKRGELDIALEKYEQSLALRYQIDDTRGVCHVLNAMALLRKDQDRYDDALEHYHTSLALARTKHYEGLVAVVLSNIGQLHILREEFVEAQKYLTEGLELAQSIDANPIIMQNYMMHARLYAGMGDVERTFQYFMRYDKARSEFLNQNALQRLQVLETKLDLERKQHESEMYRLKNVELEAKNRALKEAQEEIRQLERRNSVYAMAVTANHELNQPLMVIQGNLDLLESELNDPSDTTRKRFERIHESMGRISKQLARFKQLEKVHMGEYSQSTPMVLLDDDESED